MLAYLGAAEIPVEMNRADRRRQGRKRRTEKVQQRRRRWVEPDENEKEIRELNRLMRSELERAPDEDGEIAGPLAVVAKYATPTLLKDFGLDAGHAAPLEHWLMAKFGDVLRQPDIDGYLAWRQSCLDAVEANLRD